MKRIEDYLHLYIGCEVKLNDKVAEASKVVLSGIYRGIDQRGYSPAAPRCQLFTHPGFNIIWVEIDEFKPILRRLSSMTEEERAELWSLVFGNEHRKFTGRTTWFEKPSLSSDPRWVLLQGVERLGIEMNGHVWADSDLHLFKHNQHEVTRWLLSKGFDLFGLHEAGLCLYKNDNGELY